MNEPCTLTGIIAVDHYQNWPLFQTGLDASISRQKQMEERIHAQKAEMLEFQSKKAERTEELSDLLTRILSLSSHSASENNSLLYFSFTQSDDPFLQDLFSVSPEYILSEFLDGITRNAFCYRRDSLRLFTAACLNMDKACIEIRIGPADILRYPIELDLMHTSIRDLFDHCEIKRTEKRTSYLSVFESSYFDWLR